MAMPSDDRLVAMAVAPAEWQLEMKYRQYEEPPPPWTRSRNTPIRRCSWPATTKTRCRGSSSAIGRRVVLQVEYVFLPSSNRFAPKRPRAGPTCVATGMAGLTLALEEEAELFVPGSGAPRWVVF